MKNRIVLAIFGGIAAMGLVVAIVGICLGGRPGGFWVSGGHVVYETIDGQQTSLVDAPHWLPNTWWRGRHGNGNAPAHASGGSGSFTPMQLDGQLQKVDIDIAAGYLVIQTGEEFGLEVDGPMEYTSEFDRDDGTWEIETINEQHLLRNLGRRFLLGDRDITTTFTLTLPASFDELNVRIDMGEASISGLALQKLYCQTDMGSITMKDSSATTAEFAVNMGGITVSGFESDDCDLSCDMGSIDFSGLVRTALEADCGMGSISARMPTPASYSGNVQASLGSITVNGQKRSGGNMSEVFPSSAGSHSPTLDLECDLGRIDINFD